MPLWKKTTYSISDLREWNEAHRLELQPSYQRRGVWSATARIMLMDTILQDLPLPKMFLATHVRDKTSYRVVIDGQQRMSAILAFLRDEFVLAPPYQGPHTNKSFSDLDEETQKNFLHYTLDFNEARDPTEQDAREVYARVNKYTVPLNKQELRRADFPGDFLKESERLALHSYLEEARVFSPANRRRYTDQEYASELLAALIDGVQDKRSSLDSFYLKFRQWDPDERAKIRIRYENVLSVLESLVPDASKSRFRQKADFYSLFLATDSLLVEGYSLEDADVAPLQEDLRLLDYHIRPESDIDVCREYAVKCVSQANSAASRRWRLRFLRSVMSGTFVRQIVEQDAISVLYGIADGLDEPSPFCPSPIVECPGCKHDTLRDLSQCVLGWEPAVLEKQISNSRWIHSSCIQDMVGWSVLPRTSSSNAPSIWD